VPLGNERFQVRVELDGRKGAMQPLLDSLDRIESWLETSGVDLAEIHLNDRTHKLERRNGTTLGRPSSPAPTPSCKGSSAR